MRKKIEVKNNFHNTKTFIYSENNSVSERNFKRMEKRLCPHPRKSCSCSYIILNDDRVFVPDYDGLMHLV